VPIEASTASLRFAVIGAGRLGVSLALALRARGQVLAGFTTGSAAGRARAESLLGVPGSPDLSDLVRGRPDLYLMCVPDGVIAQIATALGAELAAGPATRSVVAHTSGATTVSVLSACEQAGAATLVFHPLQTFSEPLMGSTRFAGAGVALTPGPADPDTAATLGLRVADLLGLRPFFLADDKRGLYHTAATVACNYLVTLEHLANELFVRAGVPERFSLSLFMPLVAATLDNLSARGPVDALTGPLSRGDEVTVAGHLDMLAREAPEVLSAYRALGEATLELVAARGEVPVDTLARLRRLLSAPSTPLSGVGMATPRPHG
jgi:predicted short-subunit dehydrogenase-like oxidoreductase (DUF2520 family)